MSANFVALLREAKEYVHAYAQMHKGDGTRAHELATGLHARIIAALNTVPRDGGTTLAQDKQNDRVRDGMESINDMLDAKGEL